MDANLLWPRLRQANKQADAWQEVDDAKAALDFVVAVLWVNVLVAYVTLATAPVLWTKNPTAFLSILSVAVFLAFSFYAAALEAVTNYGAELSAALDLNRWALLSALHLPLPSDAAEEYEVWTRMGNWVRFEPDAQSRARIWYR